MNIKKVEKKLRKINNLFASIAEDKEVTAIERDLLLSYTRSLYEQMLEVETPKTPEAEITIKKETREASSIADIAKKEIAMPEPPKAAPIKEQPRPTPQPSVAPVVTQAEVTSTPTVKATVEQTIGEEFKELFAEVQTVELSDKLSHSPISDLGKAMGINEKIFTIKELFGGDNELFNSTINRLNSFDSYEKAKAYLANGIAKDKGWDDKEKLKKAINFVKLVQRRYS